MRFDAFVGPTYTAQSLIADCERCMNWYPETVESGQGKNQMYYCPTPGLSTRYALDRFPVRGEFEVNGRAFAVAGDVLFELLDAANGQSAIGNVVNDGLPVTICTNGVELCIASAGAVYTYGLTNNALNRVADLAGETVSAVGFCDGFFIALLANSRQFRISALEDSNTWDPLDIATVSYFSNNLVGMIVDHRELWLFGYIETIVYNNVGNPDFPFEPNQSSFIEAGLGAKSAVSALDNSVFWLGSDTRGHGIGWRANGYLPTRISNHGVEFAWSQYGDISNAVSYAYQEQGHTFWVVYFPIPSATWAYDVATNMWHERGFWDTNFSKYTAHRSQNHIFAFGRHLVGDWQSGAIYDMSSTTYMDAAANIRRLRRAPHISNELQRITHSQFQLDMDVGLGLQTGQGSDPQASLRWSNDGGRTWSNEHWRSAGKAGQYGKRVIWRRLGQARDRVYEVVMTDPIPARLVNAYLNNT